MQWILYNHGRKKVCVVDVKSSYVIIRSITTFWPGGDDWISKLRFVNPLSLVRNATPTGL